MTGSLAKSVKLFKIEAEKRHDNIFWAIILSSNNGELKQARHYNHNHVRLLFGWGSFYSSLTHYVIK